MCRPVIISGILCVSCMQQLLVQVKLFYCVIFPCSLFRHTHDILEKCSWSIKRTNVSDFYLFVSKCIHFSSLINSLLFLFVLFCTYKSWRNHEVFFKKYFSFTIWINCDLKPILFTLNNTDYINCCVCFEARCHVLMLHK